MRKRAREEIQPIPQIYEQERRKMLTTDLDAALADIAQHLKLFNGVCSQLHRHQRRYLIPQTPAAARDIKFGDEWCTTTTGNSFILIDDITEGGSRIIVFGTLANLQRLFSSSVVFMDIGHSKWVLVCFTRFTSSILIATIQCFQNFFVYYQINRQQHITFIHADTMKVYRSPDSSQAIHHYRRFRSSGAQRGTFCFSKLDTSWLSFPLR